MPGPLTTSSLPRRRGRPPKAVSPLEADAVVESPPVPAEPAPAPAPVAAKPARPARLYKARRAPIRHPYQNVYIPLDRGVLLVTDNWVECQLAAKVIELA